MYSSVFVVDYESITNSMVYLAAVRVYSCFSLLYVFWLTIKAVGVYVGEPVINGCHIDHLLFSL